MVSGPLSRDPDFLAHAHTYHAINVLLRWCIVILAAAISWLTLWFATPAGLLGGAAAGLVVLAVGYVGLIRPEKNKPLDPLHPLEG
jgi:uncharacterized membrane protein YedE/YeeE